MVNPFLEDGFISPNVSLNKVFIAKMPTNKIKQDLSNKTAQDIFSTELFITEIKNNALNLKLNINNIEEKDLPKYLDNLLISKDTQVQETAEMIARKFGERLGVILLTLKKCEKENKLNRPDWTDENWQYWKTLNTIILTGGLASSILGEKLKYYAEKVFHDDGIECYNIILNKDSANIAIKGCFRYIKKPDPSKKYLIFDCGQSFIKRSIIQNKREDNLVITNLEKVSSENVVWEYKDEIEEKQEALKLHQHILDTILDTIKTAKEDIGSTIVMSIANYVRNGLLTNRGGYGKLRLLTNNYEEFLTEAIYKETDMKFNIKLVHDGTAMANAFKTYENSICISLGTAFGVGFPDN